ncbi:alpha/beta hydrolase [Kitasatospora sp. NPDC091207]|uniref:alpha/beta hydrolase n=1 Tax=Kitasatospora sp. NPDC091207 TaxID=3364083 RepID=UPI00380EFCA7
MITRFSRGALPVAVTAALLAGCTSSTGSGDAARGTSSRGGAAAPTRPVTPASEATPGPAPTAAVDPALRPFYGQRIDWAPCADGPKSDAVDEPVIQCGTLKVPLDYANPADDTLDVAVVRNPAGKRDQRIGSLLVNPGGPGGSGVDMIRNDPGQFDGPLHDRFDTIGFDPRGVGLTTAVNCLDDKDRDAWVTADAPGAERGKVLADACQAKYAKVLPFIGTRNTARDMDVLRAVVGDEKLNYLGLSYGTYLGSLYAEEFPDRVGRLVLDGAVDPSVPLVQQNIEQYAEFERALQAFAAYCAEQDQCPLGRDQAAAADKLADFLDGLKQKPLTTASGRDLTANAGWAGVIDSLYGDEKARDSLRDDLGLAMARGEGDNLLARADGYNHRDSEGHYDVSADAYAAIHCADGDAGAPTGEALRAAYAEMAAGAPLISRHDPSLALFDPDCRAWPFRPAERPGPITTTSGATIVVVGSTGDTVTPYAWAENLTAQLGKAVLLTREGEGHTAYSRSACIRASVDTFLTDGIPPAAGTRCLTD